MAFWRQLSRGIRALTNRSRTDRDVADEVQDYLDHATAAHVARGLSTDEARRAAQLELGSAAAVRDEIRDYGWENIVETTIADVRYAARGLRAAPTFTVVAAITLALGIGATTAIFSALKPIVFEPLPYPSPDRVVMVWELANNGARIDGTFGMYRWLVERNRAFESLAVIRSWLPTLTADEPERLAGQRVSASYFRVLGVAPAVGTDFQPSHDQPNGPTVVILSHGFWQRRFAGNPGIVGRHVTLDDVTYTVIGVMPKGFDNVLAPAAEIWAPLQYAMSQGRAWGHHLRTVGRLRPDVTLDQASREVDSLGQAALKELNPPTYGQQLRMSAVPLGDDITRAIKPALVVISAGVALVLVIACVNVTNLLLARGVRRRGEYAVRVALGAGRRRLVRLLLTEGLLVAFLGSAIGLGVATLGVNALVALSPPELPRLDAIRIDGIVFSFAAAMATVIGLGVGLIPALQAARSDPQQDLLHSSRRLSGGHHRARRALVIAQVALAIMLLVGSGLLLRSLQRLFAIPPGFDSSQMLTMQVHPAARFSDADAAAAFYGRILDAVRQVPGVASADVTSQLPLSGDRDGYGVQFESNPNQGFSSFRYAVTPGYAKTMRIALREGRLFTDDDRIVGAPRVALISESLAAQQFGKASPLGERLRIGATDGPAFTIVGVVADLKQMSLTADEPAAVYTTLSQSPFVERSMSLVVRARGNPRGLTSSIRGAIASTGGNFVITRIATMDDLVAATAAERQFALVLFEAFALASLVLAGAGIYGLLAGSVAERTREISVRAALGASRGAIVGLVLRQGLTLTAIGIAIGLGGAAISSRAMDTLLFGISRLDPPTYGGVAILLSAVALMACLVPAWRAARVDPAATLRTE